MMSVDRKPVFLWIFVLDSAVTVSVVLVVQALTVGFDPIFFNPIIIFFAALVSMVVGSYGPFFLLYKFVFEAILKRSQIGPVALWGALIAPLFGITVIIAIVSFGAAIRLVDLALPIGLSAINLTFFYFWRARRHSGSRSMGPSSSIDENDGGREAC